MIIICVLYFDLVAYIYLHNQLNFTRKRNASNILTLYVIQFIHKDAYVY